jgi:hypothetical protein
MLPYLTNSVTINLELSVSRLVPINLTIFLCEGSFLGFYDSFILFLKTINNNSLYLNMAISLSVTLELKPLLSFLTAIDLLLDLNSPL